MMPSEVPDPDRSGAFYETGSLRLARLRVDAGPFSDALLREAAGIITATLRVSRVGFWLFLPGAQAIRCEYLYQSGRLETCEGTILYAEDFPNYFQSIASSRSVEVVDVEGDAMADEFRSAYLAPLGISSMLDVPIYRGGRIVGIVCHEHIGPPRQWTSRERTFAATVGDIAARLWEEASRRQARDRLQVYEDRMSAVQRVSDLGRLAAGIAHDFNNVLAAVIGYTDLIREAADGNDEVTSLARSLDEIVDGGRRLTGALLAFGRDAAARPRVTGLGEILERSRPVLQIAAGNGIDLDLDIAPDLSLVFVDPVQIERVLLNLIVNARDATPAGGTIRVSLREAAPPPGSDGHGSRYVLLEVRDSGRGIDPAIRDRILEPFFTTKGDAGTGLGLAIVNQVATRAGGFVEIESAPGHGTAVRVFFPRIATPDRSSERIPAV